MIFRKLFCFLLLFYSFSVLGDTSVSHPASSSSIKMGVIGGFTLGITVAPLAYLLAPNPVENKQINAAFFGGLALIGGGLLTYFYFRQKRA